MWLKQSSTINISMGPFLDKGDGVTEETGVSVVVEVSKNGGAWAARNSATAITHQTEGWYQVELDGTDTGTLGRLQVKAHEAATHLPVWHEFMVIPAEAYDTLVAGTDNLTADLTAGAITSINAEVDTALTDIGLDHLVSATVTGTDITDDSIIAKLVSSSATADWDTFVNTTDSLQAQRDNIGTAVGADISTDIAGVQSDTDDIQTRLPAALVSGRMDSSVGAVAAGAIDAAAIATDAIDADALASDAVTEIRSLVSGTADSGSTTTLVDAVRTEADTDYWKGCWLLITSGTAANQVRQITGFTPASDTITFAPALTQAVTTNTYEILPAGAVDVRLWNGTAPNNLVAGAVDADVSALQSGVIAAASFSAGAIDAAAIAADAIGSSELATTAVNEIRDAILSDSTPFAGANIDVALSTLATAASISALNDISTAQVNTEVDTALTDIGLDHLLSAAVIGTDVTDNSVVARLVSSSATADWDTFVNTTDSLQALRDNLATAASISALNDISTAQVNTEVDTALTDIGLDHLLSASVIGTDVTDNSIIARLVSASATADWDDFVNTTDSLQALRDNLATAASITALNDLSAAQVNAEVVDVIRTDTVSQIGAIPAANAPLHSMIQWIFACARNKRETTSAVDRVRNDADSGNIATAAVSDDGTTFTRAEYT